MTFAALAVGALVYSLSQSMVAPALPNIQRALHTSTTNVTWVFTAFLLAASVAAPITGRLGDMFGKRRILLIVIACFGAGTVVSALASSIGVLICGRVIQGVGAGVFPLAFGIIRDEFPADQAATGIALLSAMLGAGAGLGVVASGPIVQHLSYHWLFWLPLIGIGVSLVATVAVVPPANARVGGRVSLLGATLLCGWLGTLMLGFSEAPQWGWTSGRTLGLFAGAVLLAVTWAVAQARSPEPLIDMRVMRRRGVWTVNAAGLMLGMGMFGAFVLIPQLVELPRATGVGFGTSTTGAGLFLVPTTLMILVVSPLEGRIDKRVGSKVALVLGSLFALASLLLLAAAHRHRVDIYVAMTLLGVGIGFAFASMANLTVEAVDPSDTGMATGINTITRTAGGAIGGSVFASILSSHLARGAPSGHGFTVSFVVGAIAVGVGAVAALATPGRRQGAREHTRLLRGRRPSPGPAAPQ
jgi:EmrB/QacA subfamily drug resistance transporter